MGFFKHIDELPRRLGIVFFLCACYALACWPVVFSAAEPPTGPGTRGNLAASTPENRISKTHPIDLKRLNTITIPLNPNSAEASAASMLKKTLSTYYRIDLSIRKAAPGSVVRGILIGRDLALASGGVSRVDLEEVKYDGFVLKGAGDRVLLAGVNPQGTLYAAYAFLRKLGIRIYPWHFGEDLVAFTPLDPKKINPFDIARKPYFELRDLFPNYEKGQFGASIRRRVLGDLGFANKDPEFRKNGYLGWDHTAGYLVPLHLYYDAHPEYFSIIKGRRIPKSTPNLRVGLCMGIPDVQGIAADRTIEWIRCQPDRRFFMVSDGDSPIECQSPESLAMDPIPDYYTDRALTWVNGVARRVKTTIRTRSSSPWHTWGR